MKILLLNALREENFGHEFQQMSSLLGSNLDKFKLETQLKTLTHIVDEKQIGIKDVIKIISNYMHLKSCKYLNCLILLG